jgi:GWxTD domain-containing protein
VIVQFSNPAITQVTVDCFFKEFGPALPPFSTKGPDAIKYTPDSVFVMQLSTNQFMLTMPQRGFYHIKTDPLSFLGITLYTYDKTFPGVSNSDEMIDCTRYLMSKEEFENCKDAVEKKNCIDEFWLALGGSNERARELLKRYYGRVKEANKIYSTYTQGWKSDRGMVFIVFGPPINVYKSKRDEIWVYGNEANPNSLRFIFNKTSNPFTDNDYVMERSQFYKDNWYTAVEYWRQGLIYLDRGR